jgi:16S rRNA G527 N7-methylase RsmG
MNEQINKAKGRKQELRSITAKLALVESENKKLTGLRQVYEELKARADLLEAEKLAKKGESE